MIDEKIWLNSGPYKLAGRFFAPDSASKTPLPGIIYCSGFPGGEHGLKIAMALSQGGYSVLKFDFRGIRESEGQLDFESQVDDVAAGLTYLEKRREVNRQLIGVVGHSLGGTIAIVAASKEAQIKAVAVWAAISNYELFLKFLRSLRGNMMIRYALLRGSEYRGNGFVHQIMNLNHMDPLNCVEKISPRPLLIVHEKHDLVVPVQHAYDLYEKAREPKRLVIGEGRMHSDADPFYSTVGREDGAIRITLGWLDSIFKTRP